MTCGFSGRLGCSNCQIMEVLPGWFPQFTGLDALYIATPVADFLAIFTVGIFIAIEMRRLKDVESGKIISKY